MQGAAAGYLDRRGPRVMQNHIADGAVGLGEKILKNAVIKDDVVQVLRAREDVRAHQFRSLLLSPPLQHEQVAMTGKAAEISVFDQFAGGEPEQAGDSAGGSEINQNPACITVEHAAE